MNITESDIRHNASNSSVFLRGINYYIENRVRNFYYNELQQTAHANVVGEYTYNVEVSFGDNGEITYYECDCPAFMSYEGACKHIVAVIKFTQAELLKNNSFSKLRTANNDFDIFTYFDELHQGNIKKEVQIEINYELEHSYKSMISAIDMKLGEERLYVVRNMREFLESIDKESDLEFGKRFIFRPTEHSFSPIDQSIINLLLEIYDGEKMLEGLSTSFYRHETAFKGKKVYLSPSQTIRLLSILKNKSFSANILGKEVSNISILERDIPLAFQLYEEQQKMCLQLETEGTLIPITKKGEYIFYKENIYQPTEEQRRYFLPFYQMCVKGNKKKIDFSSKDKGRFVSEILPYIKKISNVRIDPKIAENILEENLGAKIYFDKMEDGISANVEFQYGEEIIHPFEGESKLYAGKKVIARDMIKEKQILSFFEEADFKVSKDKVFIKDQDK
ncbi:MAG: SNF2 helicase associated domain-containing protein, partial [Thermotaleaceae bacterium]